MVIFGQNGSYCERGGGEPALIHARSSKCTKSNETGSATLHEPATKHEVSFSARRNLFVLFCRRRCDYIMVTSLTRGPTASGQSNHKHKRYRDEHVPI